MNNTPKYKEALLLIEAGKYPEAIALLTNLLEMEPNTATIYEARGMSFRMIAGEAFETATREQNFQKSLEDYQKVLSLNPNSARSLAAIGEILVSSNRKEEALPYLEKAVRIDARNDRAWLFLGMSRGTNNTEQAIKDITEAILLDSKKPLYFTIRANAFSKTGQYNRAIEDLTSAIKLEPENSEHYYFRARLYKKTGHEDLAKIDEEFSEKYDE